MTEGQRPPSFLAMLGIAAVPLYVAAGIVALIERPAETLFMLGAALASGLVAVLPLLRKPPDVYPAQEEER